MGVVRPINDAQVNAACALGPDEATLKDALSRLASGLTLITCWDNGAPRGLIATSLIGLSVEPPRLLFSVRHQASAHDALLRDGRYAATILSTNDLAEAERFANAASAAERFCSSDWRLDDPFAPRFAGGLASFDLRTEHRIGADTHTIFIAEVLEVSTRRGPPLVYFERTFATLAD